MPTSVSGTQVLTNQKGDAQTELMLKELCDGSILVTNLINKKLAKLNLSPLQPQKCPRYVLYTIIPGVEHIGKTAKSLLSIFGMYDHNKCMCVLCGEYDEIDMKYVVWLSLTHDSMSRKSIKIGRAHV